MAIAFKTPQEVQREIADRFKGRRLAMNLTQKDLAGRSGVSWGSLKRFEREGLISLESLVSIALVLDCLSDFDKLAAYNEEIATGQSLDALLAQPGARRRATSKKGQVK